MEPTARTGVGLPLEREDPPKAAPKGAILGGSGTPGHPSRNHWGISPGIPPEARRSVSTGAKTYPQGPLDGPPTPRRPSPSCPAGRLSLH